MKLPHRIGFIGLGIMGRLMALNLINKGFKISVYNRTREKTQEFEKLGCNVFSSPKELAQFSNVIITMVQDDKAMDEVLYGPIGVFEGSLSGNYLINMSTVSYDYAKKLKEECFKKNIRFLDCPVSGSKPLAEKAQLVILAGAKKEDLNDMRDILMSMGSHIVNPGEPPSGTALKLAMNLIVAQMTTSLCEAVLLCERLNTDPKFIFETIENSSALNCGYFKMKKNNILSNNFEPAFSVKNILKDIGYMLKAAKEKRIQLPMTETSYNIFDKANKAGLSNEDLSAVLKILKNSGKI
jgi:3-hydroxyisobutyrate dehydrogenase-like beta-hydroxyacid dehydrogenase